jgi:ankyrin repeat protein
MVLPAILCRVIILNVSIVFVGSTALHLACISGLEQVSKLLVQKGATVSAADMNGYSALQVKLLTVHTLLTENSIHISHLPNI